ncbi:MAG TPA: sigma-70 family RNA polymerase sigma factor [Opitutaceae bacterium]|nr:sigma-70 family RNA polymerase sigma factor [Opitutaceae bacterium]
MSTLRERILEIARTLPPAPRVFAELAHLLRDANSGLDEISALIKRDSTLVGHIIRVSNSAVYGGEQPTGSVEEAVVRIGFQEVFRVVGQVASARLAERPMLSYGVDTEQLRQHMLYTAFVCEHLAPECGIDPRSAYTAGLMRPLGLLVLDRLAEQYGNIPPYHPVHDPDYLAWEGRGFGLSSCEVAGMVLREWSFPADIVEAIQSQYLLRSEDLNNRFACLVNLASGLVADDGHGLLGEMSHWGGAMWKMEALGLSESRFHAAASRAREAFAAFQRRLRGELDTEPAAPKAPAPAVSEFPPEQPHGAMTVDSSNFPLRVRVVGANDAPPVQISTAATIANPVTPATVPAASPPADDFTTFMRNYQDMVFSTAARITGNDAQAEDIAQEVFIKAFENFDRLRESPTAGGWLKTVATNLSLNHVSRYRNRWRFFSEFRRANDTDDRDEAPVEFAAPETFFADVDASERRAMVDSALAQLPEHQRVPLVLYHFEDMPYDEIAKSLRVSLAKVKTDILRGRAALAKILMRSGVAQETLNPASS